MIDIYSIQNSFKTKGIIKSYIGDNLISFDLANRHERAYAATLILDIKYPQSDIDSFLFEKLIKEDDRVLDAGANIGFTALEMLKYGAKEVLAVEAVPSLFDRLNTIDTEKVIKANFAIADKKGEVNMFISQSHNQGSSYNPELLKTFPDVYGENPSTAKVQSLSIDDITSIYGTFDAWKIDIEGAEVDMLKGAKSTLSVHPPRVIIAEIYEDFQSPFNDIVKNIYPYAYRVFLDINTYELVFCSINEPNSDMYYGTSPMFVYSKYAIE